MPYDNPLLKELGGYFRSEEPGRRERADAWATAIGLQQVDGLTPSRFLFDTAKEHIEGRITQNQARRRIRDYYTSQNESGVLSPEKEEADKVSERIVAVINDGGFEFTPEYFVAIHGKLFKGVLSSAGKIRSVNIRKREWVLKGESVTYGSADTIRQSLIRDFIDEREFDYGAVTARKAISHFPVSSPRYGRSIRLVRAILGRRPCLRSSTSIRLGSRPRTICSRIIPGFSGTLS